MSFEYRIFRNKAIGGWTAVFAPSPSPDLQGDGPSPREALEALERSAVAILLHRLDPVAASGSQNEEEVREPRKKRRV